MATNGGSVRDAGGLAFPGTKEPTSWDPLYYAFVVGMTVQACDVQVLGTRMRRVALAHGLGSFFFNTVIVALAVNTTVTQRLSTRRAGGCFHALQTATSSSCPR